MTEYSHLTIYTAESKILSNTHYQLCLELPILHLNKEIQTGEMFYKDAIFKQEIGKKNINCYKRNKLLLTSQTHYSKLTSIKADNYDKSNREKGNTISALH